VWQVSGRNFSTNSLTLLGNGERHDDQAAKLHEEISGFLSLLATRHERVLVVMPKELEVSGSLYVPHGWATTHFGALRGIDRWKDCQAVVIIGRNQPSVRDIEAMAAAVYHAYPEPIPIIGDLLKVERRGYTMRDGGLVTAEVEYHPDPRVDGILRHIRENESLQAVSRIRDIWLKDKTVYLLSSLVLDIPVDRLMDWKDMKQGGTRLERMFERFDFDNEVLPLTPEICAARFPDLWRSEIAYAQDLKHMMVREREQGRDLKSVKELIEYILAKRHFLKVLLFKEVHAKRWSLVVTQYDSEKTANMLNGQFYRKYRVKPEGYMVSKPLALRPTFSIFIGKVATTKRQIV
jgi:hypothetical protein